MKYTISSLEPNEVSLVYSGYPDTQTRDTNTGCIVHLRGDYGPDGGGYNGRSGSMYRTYWDHCTDYRTEEFAAEFDSLIDELLQSCLKDRATLLKFCRDCKVLILPDSESSRVIYGFKVITEKFAYYFRATPYKGEYDIYCYCYVRKILDKCLAEQFEGV